MPASRPLIQLAFRSYALALAARSAYVALIALLAMSVAAGVSAAEMSAAEADHFEVTIRPLLVRHCTECHGADVQEGGLRLDHRGAALAGGDGGPVIVPGDVDSSPLVRAILRHDEDLQMPPDAPLAADEVAALVEWVRAGAPWPVRETDGALPADPVARLDEIRDTHWAFQPIGRPEPPEFTFDRWSRGPLDRFIFARQHAAGLEPSPQADRATLIRRAYFDLIGLPPTHDEIEAFVRDKSPDAYEKLIDRLLAMPEYGQRWARHWLDVARYADTKGYIGVNKREERFPYAWTYRDYVVRALNEDVPYNEFITQQLAADRLELKDDERWQLAGMGFMTVGPRFRNRENLRFADRIDLLGRGLMGMTLACARCHDHKFDPLSMDDYYGLYGVFASSQEPSNLEKPLLDPPDVDAETMAGFIKRRDQVVGRLEAKRNQIRHAVARQMRAHVSLYLQHVVAAMPEHGKVAEPKAGKKPAKLRGPLTGNQGGTGRWRRYIARLKNDDPVFGLWRRLARLPADDFYFRATGEIYADRATNPLILDALRQSLPETMMEVGRIYGDVLQDVDADWRALRKQDPEAPSLPDPAAEALRQVLYGRRSPTRGITAEQLKAYYRGDEKNALRDLQVDVEKLLADSMGTAPPRAMTLVDRPRPRDAPIQIRGEASRKGRQVPRQFLRVLSHVDGGEPFVDGSGRLELARAIVHRDNPLTARVIVNRVWGWHFGRGLVETPSDFGVRGKTPSHPELLDHLARRFMDEGWSLKRLHRAIMTSATYRQASVDRSECRAVDEENVLLWKMNRRRRNYEEVRDALMAVTGELDTRLDGAPFLDLDDRRRTLYQFINRNDLARLRLSFDFGVPDATLPKRSRSTAPQQSLFLLNAPFVTRRVRRLLVELDNAIPAANVEQRIGWTYERVYGRRPDGEELALGRSFIESARTDPVAPARPGALGDAWQYGVGRYDREQNKVASFKPLAHYDGRFLWSDAEAAANDGAYATVDGGRPGPNDKQMLIRRWTAPEGGLFLFKARLELKPGASRTDGITAWVVSDRQGQLGMYNANASSANVRIGRVTVEPGEVIDFIVYCGRHNKDDEYRWPLEVWKVRLADDGKGLLGDREWPSVAAFEQSAPSWLPPMSPWEQYVQALLISNEFMFID